MSPIHSIKWIHLLKSFPSTHRRLETGVASFRRKGRRCHWAACSNAPWLYTWVKYWQVQKNWNLADSEASQLKGILSRLNRGVSPLPHQFLRNLNASQWPSTPQGRPSLPCPLPRPFPISHPCRSIRAIPTPEPAPRWYSHTADSLARCLLPPRLLANILLAWEQMIKWADVQKGY